MQLPSLPLRVIIVTPFGPGGRGGMDRLSDAIIESVHSAFDDVEVQTLVTYGQRSRALMPAYFLLSLLELARVRGFAKADLLHINVAGGGSAYRKAILAFWAQCLGIPYVVHLHGSRFRETWPTSVPILSQLLNGLFSGSRRILVLGKVWADYIVERLPGVGGKVCILPNATRSRPARSKRADPSAPAHIVFMGLLGARKGSLLLIEALSGLDPAFGWKATIAGNGDVAGHEELAERLGVANRISLPGWLGPAEIDQLIYDADMLVLPSFAENLPMVIIEAFAQGVPVVATPVGAVAEVVEDGTTGLLTPVGDVAALTAAMQILIESPDLRQSMGAAARESHRTRFELTGYTERLVEIWRQSARSAR
jgi:glycosyltransferase involved in cell wall biosynthesis